MKRLVGVCALTLAVPAMGDIVMNGGFESGNGIQAVDWEQIEIGPASAWRVGSGVGVIPYEGDSIMYLSVINDPNEAAVAEIRQQTVAGSIVAGREYDFSFAGLGPNGSGTGAFFELLWFDGDGSHGGGSLGSATGRQNWSFGADWALGGMDGLIAPDGADSVLIQIGHVTEGFDGPGGYVAIDAVSITLVPTPGAVALLGVSGIARRRRRS